MIIRHGFWWDRFWGMIPKVLPTVYDDSLSYYEVLNKLIKATGELASAIDGIDPDAIRQSAAAAAESAEDASASAQQAQTYEEGARDAARTEVGLAIEPWVSYLPGEFVYVDGLDIPLNTYDLWVSQSGYTVMITGHLNVLDAASIEESSLLVLIGRLPAPARSDDVSAVGNFPAFIDRGAQGLIPCYMELKRYTEDDTDYWGISISDALEDNDVIIFSMVYPTNTPIERGIST